MTNLSNEGNQTILVERVPGVLVAIRRSRKTLGYFEKSLLYDTPPSLAAEIETAARIVKGSSKEQVEGSIE